MDASEQSSELDKYKTTLNFDDLTPNSSLGLMSSRRTPSPSAEHQRKHRRHSNNAQTAEQELFVRNLQGPATEKSNLKLEELFSSKQPAPTTVRESRWQRGSTNNQGAANQESFLSNMQDLIAQQSQTTQELHRIEQDQNLSKKDRQIAIKSVRSLSRTITDLLGREKQKLTEHIMEASQPATSPPFNHRHQQRQQQDVTSS